jgi:uracil-DNA glycosylase family 4
MGSSLSTNKNKKELLEEAHSCQLCPRMGCSRKVLSDRNGDWSAEILFVAEAPGRLGAEVTGIPLFGDRTGDRFDEILAHMKLRRSDVFLTNVVLCNPRDNAGNNDTPTRLEINNCFSFLKRTIQYVDPTVVIALGRVALEALKRIDGHGLSLKESGGRLHSWNGRHLGVLYHPGPRTAIHRPWKLQLEDAKKLGLSASFLAKKKNHFHGASKSDFLLELIERTKGRRLPISDWGAE